MATASGPPRSSPDPVYTRGVLLSLFLALSPQTSWMTTPVGALQVSGGEERKIMVSAPPEGFRSVGIWWRGSWAMAQWKLIQSDGSLGNPFPITEVEDLSPAHAGATGPAGPAQVGGLLHSYAENPQGVQLTIPGPANLQAITLVWIPDSSSFSGSSSRTVSQSAWFDRASWNADPPACSSGTCPVTHVAIHHTANSNEYLSPGWPQCAANVKAIQIYHMATRGWCDIGYLFLVCPHGLIWEGRAGDGTVGAHDGYNCGSMGVSVMGWFHPPYNQAPTQASLDAIADLGAWKCDQKGLDPLGVGWYVGYGGFMRTVYGHRNVSSTACPGDLLYGRLGNLRSGMAARIAGDWQQIILDNPSATKVGNWTTGTATPDRWGPDYAFASTSTSGNAFAWWSLIPPQSGDWEISFWWPEGGNRSPEAKFGLRIQGQLYSTRTDQRIRGGQWNVLGKIQLTTGNPIQVGLSNQGTTSSVVLLDAVRLILR